MPACAILMLDPNGRTAVTRDMELIRKIVLAIQAKRDARPEGIEIPITTVRPWRGTLK